MFAADSPWQALGNPTRQPRRALTRALIRFTVDPGDVARRARRTEEGRMYVGARRKSGSASPVDARTRLMASLRQANILQRCGSRLCPPGACDHSDERVVARDVARAGPEFAPQ